MTHFILASQSPRRRALLSLLNYPFDIIVANVDEDQVSHIDPGQDTILTARLKAEAVAQAVDNNGRLIIAADTTVALGNQRLNKPADAADARAMLAQLRGRTHDVHTGVALLNLTTGQELTGVHTAVVTMRPYTDEEIDRYIATGDPLDKAGAYAIQHTIFRPAARLDGCYLGVMGLSICHLIDLLAQLGVPPRVDFARLELAHQHFACPVLDRIRQKYA